MKKKIVDFSKFMLALIFSVSVYNASAQETDYDFSDDKTGTTIFYNVTVDEFPLEVAVAFGSYEYNSYSGVVQVPDRVVKDGWGYSVTSIWENAFAHSKDLTEVALPENIIEIGEGAFMSCAGLKKITPFNNVESIGMIAFFNCSSLEEITFGDKLSSIGDNAFNNCKALTSITIKSTTPPTIIGTLGKTKATIYVPADAVEAYKLAEGWNKMNILPIAE